MRPVRFGIVATLKADAAVSALVGGAVYHAPAPTTAALPYVTVAQQPGGRREWTYQLQAMRVTLWLVKGLAADKETSELIDEACEAALNDCAMSVAPYRLLVCRRQTDVAYPERDAGQVLHHSGGIYEIGVS